MNCDIKNKFTGRSVLYYKLPDGGFTKDSIYNMMVSLWPCHEKNKSEINYLYNFYKGDQPVLYRKKEIRPEIQHDTLQNRAFEIVEFKKGYEFSHPTQYTLASKKASQDNINTLNTYTRLDCKDSKDLDLVEWMYVSGNSYKLILPNQNNTVDDAPYKTRVLDPRKTFVVYNQDDPEEVICAGLIVKNVINGKPLYTIGIYTDTDYYTWSSEDVTSAIPVGSEIHKEPNRLGIPIVEYSLNQSRMGYVELCITLFNALNVLSSNRIEAVEQFVQAILVFLNCETEKDEDGNDIIVRNGDQISVKGSAGLPADIKFITAQLSQSDTQITGEDLLNAIYSICGVPGRQDRARGGGDTGQAVVLRNGWGDAEARAKSTEKRFKKSEYEYLKIVLKICRILDKENIGDLTLSDIDVKFTRNRSDNMLVKAQTLEILLRSGVHPQIAFESCEMFGDPVYAYIMSKSIIDNMTESAAREADQNSSSVKLDQSSASSEDEKNSN